MTAAKSDAFTLSFSHLTANHVRKEQLDARFPTCETTYVKASIVGRTVGFALWQTPVNRSATQGRLSPEEARRVCEIAASRDAAKVDADWKADEGFDAGFYGRWTAAADAKRIEAFEGRPHWFLETLGVHPDVQGLGGAFVRNATAGQTPPTDALCFLQLAASSSSTAWHEQTRPACRAGWSLLDEDDPCMTGWVLSRSATLPSPCRTAPSSSCRA